MDIKKKIHNDKTENKTKQIITEGKGRYTNQVSTSSR